MKLRGSAVRFLLVSATAPNIDDLANWIGRADSSGPATVFRVGSSPVLICVPPALTAIFSLAMSLDHASCLASFMALIGPKIRTISFSHEP
jgi:hypothetical protein